jgi:putative membrane protein
MPAMNDELANDRTFLAWLRTGIALFGLGFVVAKVALLVDASASGLKSQVVYTTVGVVMVVCGAALILVGYTQHRRVARVLADAGVPRLPLAKWPQTVTAVSVLGALVLAFLIAASS